MPAPRPPARRAWQFWRPDVAAEVEEELAFHLEMRTRDYAARGLTAADAERAARARFGDVARVHHHLVAHDRARERRTQRRAAVDRCVRDLRLALRGLWRTPAFAAAVVCILALGIGTASAMVSVYDAVLRRPLPVRDQDRLAELWTYQTPGVEVAPAMSTVAQFGRASRTVRAVAGVAHWGATVAPLLDGDRSLVLNRVLVSGNFFEVLGARPAAGRLLRADDEQSSARLDAGTPGALVLSYAAWRSQFGGDPGVVGRRLLEPYGRKTYTVVGVAPAGLDYPSGAGYWIPLWGPGLQALAVARLAPGATLAAARAEFLAAARPLEPGLRLRGAVAAPLARVVLGDVRPYLVVLTAAVGLLLVIACTNVGGLLLVRGAGRARELAVRRALGASAGDVARLVLAEGVVLGVAGGVLGLGAAEALRRLLVTIAPARLPRLDVVTLQGTPVGVTLAVTLVALLAFSVLPALASARVAPASPLRQDARSGGASRRGQLVRRGLVAAQVALAVVMLAAAGLLTRSLVSLERLPLGYRAEHLSILAVSWNGARDTTPAQITGWGEQALPRLAAIPGVTAVTPILIPPFLGPNVFHWRFEAEGRPEPAGGEAPNIPVESAGPDFFRTLDTPLLRGRGFLATDRDGAPLVAVVSEGVARRFWPGEDPLGRRLRLPPEPGFRPPPGQEGWITVVGVVADARFRALRAATPTVYLPWRQSFWQGNFAVRSTGELAAVLPAMRRALREVDPDLALWDARTMDALLGAPLAQPRLGAVLVTACSAVALLLCAVGLYGVMASLVRQRTREIGVRMTLGATPAGVRRAVLRDALGVVAAGLAVGLAGALAGARLFTALLFEVRPTDPATLAAVCALLVGVALLAAYGPARRATRVDPAVALRAE